MCPVGGWVCVGGRFGWVGRCVYVQKRACVERISPVLGLGDKKD